MAWTEAEKVPIIYSSLDKEEEETKYKKWGSGIPRVGTS